MKKLIALCVALALSLTACASETATSDLGATISDLASQAQTLAADADIDPEMANAIQVVSQNATTVGVAATGGEVSDGDLDSLIGALDRFDDEIDAARDTLDQETQDQLDALESDLRDAVEQLNG